ncbi:Chromatin modification-related protein EAF1 [Ceratocystis fimbriata CBS 114723]|uniref:Vacuolar import and degradation protein 21 n=1 Tax=Ceratocystis fimbriata CBS 114723 TaxID=1035309 RepID=A0A2C5X781_9PEZI|nr:Chromatin modification-related protein EAF1 [Ceratocystis fimbriata CBS 114723]
MSVVGPADGSRLMRSGTHEQSSIIPPRKRKYRELWAVAHGCEFNISDDGSKGDALPHNGSRPIQADDLLTLNKSSHIFAVQTPPNLHIDIIKPSLSLSDVFKFEGIPPPQATSKTSPDTTSPNGQSHATQNLPSASSNTPTTKPSPRVPTASTSANSSTAVTKSQSSTITIPSAKPSASPSPSLQPNPAAAAPRAAQTSPTSTLASLPAPTNGAQPQANPSLVANGAQSLLPLKTATTAPTAPTPTLETNLAKSEKKLSTTLDHDTNGITTETSSPESLAATATTPAAHDVSAGTSPGNDTTSIMDRPDVNRDEANEPLLKKARLSEKQDTDSTSEAIRAQLLEESAALVRKQSVMSSTSGESSKPTNPLPQTLPPSPISENKEIADSQESNTTETDEKEEGKAGNSDSTKTTHTQPLLAPNITSSIDITTANPSTDEKLAEHSTGPELPNKRQKTMSEIMGKKAKTSGTINLKLLSRVNKNVANKPPNPHVIFGKQPQRTRDLGSEAPEGGYIPGSNYFTPLFFQTFIQSSKWMRPLDEVLYQAHKTITTTDLNVSLQDAQACRILRRVYHLQQGDKWSLRQPKRAAEPTRPPSHWDTLLQEMRWMRTDFRQEHKWKRAAARSLAFDCAEWVESTKEDRLAMQVPACIPPRHSDAMDIDGEKPPPVPDLDPSSSATTPTDSEELHEPLDFLPPSALFSLGQRDLVFEVQDSPTAESMLLELPMFGAPLKVPEFDGGCPDYDPDAHWRRPAIPLSKYVERGMNLKEIKPPHKPSRFRYALEDDDENAHPSKTIPLPPKCTQVALFSPEHRQTRDRLHMGHQFRPPTEFPMPPQSFFENRHSSMWTQNEDEELCGLVQKYSYNWSLISSLVNGKSQFISAAERRTPWECFERWIMLDGLPPDMQKTQYFKAYNNRIENAQRLLLQSYQVAQQQAAANPNGAVTPSKRRQSTPVKVERRRNQKHISIIESMRKLAKKREAALQKQQQAANNATVRKPGDITQPRPTKTPRDYSLMRFERDQAITGKMMSQIAAQREQRRQIIARQNQIFAVATSQMPHGNAAAMSAQLTAGNNPRINVPNPAMLTAAVAAGGQARPRIPIAPGVSGLQNIPAHLIPNIPVNGVGQVPMNANIVAAAQQRLQQQQQPATQADVLMEVRRITEQQRALQQQQQPVSQQSTPNQSQSPHSSPQLSQGTTMPANSPPVRAGVPLTQQAILANAQAVMNSMSTNGTNLAAPNRNPHVAAALAANTTPRPPGQLAIPPSLLPTYNILETTIRQKHPTITPDQVRQLATTELTRMMLARQQTISQSAMTAASVSTPKLPPQTPVLQQTSQAEGAVAQRAASVVSGSATPKSK